MATSLPSELLVLIFESLYDTSTALKSCSLVSTTWHAAAATVLFSSLSLLCSVGEPDPTAPLPKFKRHFGFRYGLPIYRKTWPSNAVDPHCICHRYKDHTAQLFLASGASSSAHITRNVAELTLKFCCSSSEAVYHGPHSLQLYPDPFICSLLRLVDEFSFTHLRFLNVDCAPQVLYFLESLEPFGGILSSAGQSLEEITFSGFDSMQNTDIRRMLNKHRFSCVRFPHLRRLVFQGLLGTEVSPGDARKMNCVLELGRRYSTTYGVSGDAVVVFYSYWDSSKVTGHQQPDGFSRFEIPNWCCFSGPCSKLEQLNRTGSLADFMGLGSIKWTLPTIGTVLHALQSDTLGRFAHALQIRVSSTDVSGPKLLAYITQTFPRVSSLALCFNTAFDIDQVVHTDDHWEETDGSQPATVLLEHLKSLSRLRTLRIILSHNAAAMLAEECFSHAQTQTQTITGNNASLGSHSFIIQSQNQKLRNEQLIPRLDELFEKIYLRLPKLRGMVLQVSMTQMWITSISTPPISGVDVSPLALLTPQEIALVFRRTQAANSGFLTVQIS